MSGTAPERYLRKAHESLASAEADLAAERYSSAANRAYYAAFQSAVAALVANDIRPRVGSWEHKFVMREFSGRLVHERGLLQPDLRGVLERLLEVRVVGDYQAQGVGAPAAARAVSTASSFVRAVAQAVRDGVE